MDTKRQKELTEGKYWFDRTHNAKTLEECEKAYEEMPKEIFKRLKKDYYIFCNIE